jgi:hypothetical protein
MIVYDHIADGSGAGAEADQSEKYANRHGVSINLSAAEVMCPLRR